MMRYWQKRKRRYTLILPGVLFLLLGLLTLTPSSASAHAQHAVLLRADPVPESVLAQPPTVVRLWFSEPVQLVGQTISVSSPGGAPIAVGKVREQGTMLSAPINATQPGTYLVSWQVVSQDTDPVSGRFAFSIKHVGGVWAGTESSGTSPLGFWLQTFARFLHFLGYALGFGTFAFLYLILAPLDLARQDSVQQRLWRLVNMGILLLLLAEGCTLGAQIVSLSTRPLLDLTLLGDVLSSNFGRVMAQRSGAALALWILIGSIQQGQKRALPFALGLGVVLAAIDGEASHVLTSRLPWLALLANTLHLAAMGVWVGGLFALVSLWKIKELYGLRNTLVARFGQLALAAVGELVLTGTVMAWLHLAHLADLSNSAYGRTLVVKLLALLLPLFFSFIARRVRPMLSTRFWQLEMLALLGILLLAGILVSLPPPA